MAVSLAGQVAIVTGAARGLGREYALDLARHGAKVLVNDLGGDVSGEGQDETAAQQVAAEIRAMGGEALVNGGDVSSYDACFEMVKQAMDAWGRVDAVVCNAGILRDLALHNMSEKDWDLVLAVHLKQCYNLMHHVWPVFRQQSYGRVVLATSSSGLYGNFGQANYGAAKAGMVGLMNVAKLEGAKYNIMVNCIGPGAATRMTVPLMGDRAAQMGPEHVAPAVTYLCSPQCVDSGIIIEGAAGRFNRCSFVRSKGVRYEGPAKTADWFEENWKAITDLDGAQAMWDVRQTRAEAGRQV